jgi:hypothetical protein
MQIAILAHRQMVFHDLRRLAPATCMGALGLALLAQLFLFGG